MNKKMFLKSTAIGFLVAGLIASTPVHAGSSPGWELNTSFGVPENGLLPAVLAPPSAKSLSPQADSFLLSMSDFGTATDLTPELATLAASLRNSPYSIFSYVRNKVEYQPYWGSHKGAHGTYIDGAGNDMDQASLLIALLNAAGYSDTNYVRGSVIVPISSVDLHDLVRWLGTSSALAPTAISAAGIPFDTSLLPYGFLRFNHIWVRAVIDGVSYDLDPSYKRIQQYAGINYKGASGYSRSQLLTDAGGTEGADFVQSLNRAGVENRLGQYAQTLRNYIRTNVPGYTFEQVVGSGTLYEETVASLAAGAPRFAATPAEVFTTIPAILRNKVRVQVGTQFQTSTEIDVTIPTDALQNRPLSLTFSGDNAQLMLDGTVIAEETTGSGPSAQVTLSTEHPGGRSINPPSRPYYRTGIYDLSYAFYPNPKSNGRIDASNRKLGELKMAGYADDSTEMIAESLHGLALRWIKRSSLSAQIVSKVTGCYGWEDTILGRTGQEASFFVDMYGMTTIFDSSGAYNRGAFNASAFLASAMEHGVIEERAGGPALSTAKCLTLANDRGQKIFLATPANFSTVYPELTGYNYAELSFYVNYPNSTSMLVHDNAQISLNQWAGYGFATMGTNFCGMIIAGGYSGGYYSFTDTIPFSLFSKEPGDERDLSEEPVDLATGGYTMSATDLSLGEANTPRGLLFSRTYESSRNFQPSALGNGWRHSCEGRVLITSDLDAAFGYRQPSDAVQTIIGAIALSDFSLATYSPKELMTGILSANWLANRITNNAANVQIGEQVFSYTSLPDGSWNPPPGSTTALTGSNGSFAIHPRFGGYVTFDTQNRISQWADVDLNTKTYAYDPSTGRLSTVTDSQNRSLTFGYFDDTNPLIHTVSDGTGRVVTFSYLDNNLTGIQDVENYNTTFVYNGRNLLEDWLDHSSAYIMRNTYDSQDRVKQQLRQGIADHIWKFTYTPGVTREWDPLNNLTTHYFDTKNRPLAIVDAIGNISTESHDSQNHITQRVDGSGRKTTYIWDANQNLRQIIDNAGKITYRDYDGSLRLWKITDPTNRVTEFGYDTENHLETITDPGLRVTRMTYWPDGRLHEVTDAANKKTTFSIYDQWANPTDVTRADGSAIHADFNARGDRTSYTDGRQKTTGFGHDKRRLLTSRTDPYLRTSHWQYDSNGNLHISTDRRNKVTTTVFNNLGKLRTIDAPDTGTVTMGYDLRDLQTTVTDGLNHTTTTGFDIARRPKTLTDALSIQVTEIGLDGAGRLTQNKNGLLQNTRFYYDTAGRLAHTLDPLNRQTDHTYDDAGRPATLVNRRTETFQTDYETDGLPSTFTYPSGRQSRVVDRDPVGRPKTLQDPSGQQTILSHDGMGRVKTLDDAAGSLVWEYDGEGNQTDLTEGTANIHRSFDDLGHVHTCTDTSGVTVTYTYDNEGNLETIVYPGNKTVTYHYDGSNRLKTVTDWAQRLTTYYYDEAGRLEKIERPNNTQQRIVYDDANRLQHTYEEKGTTAFWDAGYGFDNAYRLTSYTPTPITKTLPPPPASMTYDSDNRLDSYNGVSVASDDNGNLQAAPLNGTLLGALGWDARNRLINAGGITYAYDAENRRISSTTGNQTTGYTWSRSSGLDRLLVKTNPDGSVTRYIHGLGLLYEETTPAGGGTPTTQYYHYNWQGSTMALTDTDGNVTARMSYSPYGEVTVVSGTPNTPFLFNGQFGVMTESNGLFAMQSRLYSPVFRRFLSEDPIGFRGGLNTLAYIGGDPVNFIDPFGLDANALYDRATHTLTITDAQTKQTVVTSNIFSGNGRTANDPAAQHWSSTAGYPSDGPLPAGTYLIGTGAERRDHVPTGDAVWFPLYGPNGAGGYSYQDIPVVDPVTGVIVHRGGFNLHTGLRSDGCITVRSDLSESDSAYPQSADFDRIKNLLNKTTTFEYKGGSFTGTITVK